MVTVTDFKYHGERWRRVSFEPERSFCVGVDLGQASDPTAICVIEHHITPVDGEFVVSNANRITKQSICERFDVRHLERLPLGTSYPAIIQYVGDMLEREPLREFNAQLVIDRTGVGRAVFDLFRDAGLRPIGISISGGEHVNFEATDEWSVPKRLLISTLDAKLAMGELRFAAALREAPAMQAELKDFRRNLSDSGRATYAARTGSHDDLILATAIAVYWVVARKSQGEVSWGYAKGLF